MNTPQMPNPLLIPKSLPEFSQLQAEHIQPAIEAHIAANRRCIEEVLARGDFSWQGLVEPLAEADDRLSQAWSPVSHLNSVLSHPKWRQAHDACLPLLSEFSTWVGQHTQLCAAYQTLKDSPEFASLNAAQQKMLENTLRDFHLAGVDLAEAQKTQYAQIQSELSELTNQFANQVLDATQGWQHLLTKAEDLAGLPESALQAARERAQAKELEGYLLTLDFPSYHAVITYAQDRALRERIYQAYVTRASDQGPHAGQWDNSQVMERILALRTERTHLLGFETYADYSLATKMATSAQEVLDFLQDLAHKARPQALADKAQLAEFAAQEGVTDLQPWDLAYFSEKLRQREYDLSQEELRPWFPAADVIQGMFDLVGKIFGLRIEEDTTQDVWHTDVSFYWIYQGDSQQACAGFYLDPYAREHKRGGAWMDVCQVRRRTQAGEILKPIAYLVCNFNPPLANQPALLTHDEVTTLFHEFGHGLHHMLTQVEVAEVSGIHGVPWDAVELPSQFMENFCWQPEGLALIARHYQTGQALPTEKLDKLLAAKNFQSGMFLLRQIEFALFDLRLHAELGAASSTQIQALLDDIRQQWAVVPVVPYNRFQHGFTHIFAGGYAAGYYSYLWAEVLSADAFSAFEEEGILNPATGQRFLQCILQAGGSADPLDLFIAFRGRAPQVDAFLRHSGIQVA
ncbi:oligopeptidase A [Allopseudospirillum japonicum]|uniref:oligopeptidase A n=2 Tax=Allopseudospirillum japonicum TaxID=64971 RepID=A0A1H6TDH1_9GAMM|nr:oligopeptidase A [Allopseudospirillum japonicum]